MAPASVNYDFSMQTGRVKEVWADMPEVVNSGNATSELQRFGHQYSYDLDGRIEGVETSRDGWLWIEEAKYHYLPHGPLARIELGQYKVQGIDYAYTSQGWLKAINGEPGSQLRSGK